MVHFYRKRECILTSGQKAHIQNVSSTKRLFDQTSPYKTSTHTTSPSQNVSLTKRLLVPILIGYNIQSLNQRTSWSGPFSRLNIQPHTTPSLGMQKNEHFKIDWLTGVNIRCSHTVVICCVHFIPF
jgi:hypothetical protein